MPFYIGAPYNQSAYAYGINVHVGPVSGWQPPRAPASEEKSILGRFKDTLNSPLAWVQSVSARFRRAS
ncbi:hypothetical protein [Paraburkholderia sp. GAS32]|uniref:hypothetical protein n=1 Tax=Paraburkholderia sp. GAS32 TaxID=3035129 RepID=UPI003D19E9A1